jgi:hypothetical protein
MLIYIELNVGNYSCFDLGDGVWMMHDFIGKS